MSLGASALSSGISKDVRPLLDLIDEMRSLGIEQDLPLPQIAVMGDQSSGKSSVLEALSGVPFPRGAGLVTRCPCQLTMKRTAEGTPWRATIAVQRAYGSVGQKEIGGSVNSAAELTEAIERVTVALTAGSAAFSSDSIVIKISSPDVPDLTLIDLPGIVRTVTSGQDASVITEVNQMVEGYLRQERTIVLAIVPSNQDVATVDILERAMRVDPTGERTIGVLTKPDLVDEGASEEVLAVLRNERKPLKLGYVIVKNKSAAELKRGADGPSHAAMEKKFFDQHEGFKHAPKELVGVCNLTAKCTKLLTKRIELVLPELKWELQEQFAETEKAVDKLGSAPPTHPLERSKLVLRIFSEYCTILRRAARGDYREAILSQNPDLRLRASADRIFSRLEMSIVDEKPDFEATDFTQKLHQELKALKGRELPGLLNSYFFYGFMARHVEMWRPLIEGAKLSLYDAVHSSGSMLADELLTAYPGAAVVARETLARHLEESSDAIAAKIEEVFKHESDPFISKNELSEAILNVRFARFEKALEAVMLACGTGPSEASAATVAAARDQQAQDAHQAQQQQQRMTEESSNADASNTFSSSSSTTPQSTTSSENAAAFDATTEASVVLEAASHGEATSEADDARRAKREALKEHPLKELVLGSLGRWYMANHGVTSMSMVEDMRTVLIAYWGVASKRITENICMLLETHLLALLAEDVEKRLLQLAQNPLLFDEILAQPADVKNRRAALRAKKDRVAAALNSISKFAPHVLARPRQQHKDQDLAPQISSNATPANVSSSSAGKAATKVPQTLTRDAVDMTIVGAAGGANTASSSRTNTAAAGNDNVPANLLETFRFSSNGDNGGFVYWLGTSGKRERFANPMEKGRVRVTSSGLATGDEKLLVARKRQPCWTLDQQDAWICLDLGRNRALMPSHYTLCNGSPEPGLDLLQWRLEGYDAATDVWHDLSAPPQQGAAKPNLPSPWGVATFPVDPKGRVWRYLRIHHTGPNSRGTNELPVCAFEFYGQLFSN